MKTSPIIIALALGVGLLSCNEKSEKIEVEQENGELPEGDTTRRLTDGTRIPVVIEMKDSINMPEELIQVIKNTEGLHPDSILVKRRFVENGTTFFELEFKMKGNRTEVFTFDDTGKRRSDALDNNQ